MGQDDSWELLEDPSELQAPHQLDKRLTRRQKLLRAGGASLAVLLALTVIASQFGYLDFTRELWENVRLATTNTLAYSPPATRPMGTVQAGPWASIALPVPANLLADAVVAPTNPPTMYICSTATPPEQASNPRSGGLLFWSTHDAGQHWLTVPIIGALGISCGLSLAPDDPHTLTAIVYQDYTCASDPIYRTHDDGEHWNRVATLPRVPANIRNCALWVIGTARHLIVRQWYERTDLKQDDPNLEGSAMYHSEDEGATWSASALTDLYMGIPVALADGATLLTADIRLASRTEGYTTLWTSSNTGESWDTLAKLTNDFESTRILVSPSMRVPKPSLGSPFYLLAQTVVSKLLRLQIAQITDDKHWTTLPPLPIAGATADHLGITQALTVTPSGKLLALGLGPNDQIPPGEQYNEAMFDRQWLWEWDPRTAQWSVVTPALDVPWPTCSDGCWSAFVTQGGAAEDLWLRGWDLEGETPIFHIHLPN